MQLKEGVAMKSVAESQTAFRGSVISVLVGVVGALLVSLLLLSMFSIVMTIRDLPSVVILLLACVSIAGGAFVGGMVAARLIRNRGLLTGAVTGLTFFLILYLTGLIMHQAGMDVWLLVKVAVAMLAGGIGGITGVNMRKRRTR